MDADEAYRSLAAAVRGILDAHAQNEREVAELRATLDGLLEILRGKGLLNDGHRRLLERGAGGAGRAVPSRVRLRVLVDKYRVPSSDVDCAALHPICHGRCCAFSFELTTQDLDEGVVRWEVEEPYLIRHESDGHCSHLDRRTLGCGVYAQRPAACRSYDCRDDPRIWIDFSRRLPAPMPPGLRPARPTAPTSDGAA